MVYQIRVRFGLEREPDPLWEGTKEELIKAFPVKTHPKPVWRWLEDAKPEAALASQRFSLWARFDRDSAWVVTDQDPRLQ